MIPPPFRYRVPSSVPEALAMLSEDPGAVVLAGGQTLVNALKLDLVSPSALVDVHRLAELRGLEEIDGGLRLGAALTYDELARHPLVQHAVPVLARVAGRLVDRQVRNRGTLGGNCCLNDPTSNLPPLLAALGARFHVEQAGAGPRSLGAEEFFLGSLLTVAHGPVLLTAVTVPATPSTTRVAYRHQLIGADSWALARAVVAVDTSENRVTQARVYLGAVPDSPVRLPHVEAAVLGAGGPDVVPAALAAFDAGPVETHADAHGSAAYRRRLARVQLGRALTEVLTPPVPAEEAA